MFISFYLTYDIYSNGDILEGNRISASDLFGGLIWGHGEGFDTPILVFDQSDIDYLLFLVCFSLLMRKKKRIPVSLKFIILVFVMEYTGTITTWFETGNSDYKYTIAYAFESITCALTGMMFKNMENCIHKINRVWLYILSGIMALFGAFMLQADKCVGIGYHGLSLYLYVVGVSIIVIRCGQSMSAKKQWLNV